MSYFLSRQPALTAQRVQLAVAIAVTVLVGAGPARARVVPADEIRQDLYSTCFVTDKEGWAVGDLGRIFHTTDGGQNWEIQDAGTKRPFVSISCIDKNNVWVAGQAGQVARTADGGKTWKQLKTGTDKQILSIKMFSLQVGMAVGDFGTMLRTEDGGETWAKVTIPTDVKLPEDMTGIVEPGDIVLYSVSAPDSEFVAVCGEFGVILVSADGGKTFQFRSSGVETTLFGIFFADHQRGWAVGMETAFIETKDGGATWQKRAVKTPPGFSLALFDVEVKDNLGWAIGNSGYLLVSTDAGETWNLVDVPAQMGSYWFREVHLLPNNKGFIVGNNGIVLSIDGTKFKASKSQL